MYIAEIVNYNIFKKVQLYLEGTVSVFESPMVQEVSDRCREGLFKLGY
jgi:hypothetical protein